jgi:hypothetical protein
MKMPSKLLVLFIGLAGIVSHRSATVASQPDRGQLTPEQLQLYSDFIDSFSKTNFKFLSSTTFPLELSALPKAVPCLQGLQLDGTEDVFLRVPLRFPLQLGGNPGARESRPSVDHPE